MPLATQLWPIIKKKSAIWVYTKQISLQISYLE